MVVVVHAELLEQTTSFSVQTTELVIVARLRYLVSQQRSLCDTDNDAEKQKRKEIISKLNSLLEELGFDYNKFTLVKGNNIWCYFICMSEEHLSHLRQHYESGLMKSVLSKIFTLVAQNNETISTRHLEWKSVSNG